MKNKINVAELLKDCPKGMEFDCTMYDNVKLDSVDNKEKVTFPIRILREDGNFITLTKYGQYIDAGFAKCVIFPKGKTTWEGFAPPCNFKDGDIVVTSLGNIAIVSHKICNNIYRTHCFFYRPNARIFATGDSVGAERLATEEEKEKLFKAIKEHGYKWNAETKTLEKLIEQKFKVGDRIRLKENHNYIHTITGIREEENKYECGVTFVLKFSEQDNWELVPNKFDITTLKPFESRVLVRDRNNDEWRGHFFSHYYKGSDRPYICIGQEGLSEYRFCIPFEGNEYLLGKTEDCNEFYKTWK